MTHGQLKYDQSAGDDLLRMAHISKYNCYNESMYSYQVINVRISARLLAGTNVYSSIKFLASKITSDLDEPFWNLQKKKISTEGVVAIVFTVWSVSVLGICSNH